MEKRELNWHKSHCYTKEQLAIADIVLDEVQGGRQALESIRAHPLREGGYIAKHTLVHVYRQRVEDGRLEEDPVLLSRIRMKPIR